MTCSGAARVAGVIGWPVTHSKSPRVHGYWLDQHGIDGAYVPLAVKPDDLHNAVRALPKLGFQGANVTVPHKQAAAELCDDLEPHAQRLGVVNTLICSGTTIRGANTDGLGFLNNLFHGAPAWRPERAPAVVLGAGGAARAVVVALLDAGADEIRVLNRTRMKAEALADEFGHRVRVHDWGDWPRALPEAGLLVNTTSLGMTGQPELAIDLNPLPAHAVVNDIVYEPLETALLAAARARGNAVVDGLGMLLYQAVPGFQAWFGVHPKVTDDLRARVLAAD
jgi:shikimate dehydrogenase